MDRYHHHRLVSKRRPPLSPALPLSVFLTHPSSEKPTTEIFVSQLFFLLFKIITTSGRTKIASKVYNAFTSYKVSMWYVNHGVQLCTDWYSVLHDNGPTGAQHICRSVSGAWRRELPTDTRLELMINSVTFSIRNLPAQQVPSMTVPPVPSFLQ